MVQEGPLANCSVGWEEFLLSLYLLCAHGLHRSYLTWILTILKLLREGHYCSFSVERSEWGLGSSQDWEESEPFSFWFKYVDLFNWGIACLLYVWPSPLTCCSGSIWPHVQCKLYYSKPASITRGLWFWVVRMSCDWSLGFPWVVFTLLCDHSQALSQVCHHWPMSGGVGTDTKCYLPSPGQPHPLVGCEEYNFCTHCLIKVMKHEKWKIQWSTTDHPASSYICLSDNSSDCKQ